MNTLTKRAKKICKQGKVLFYVHAFPENLTGFITEYRPLSKPYFKKYQFSSGAWFCKAMIESCIDSNGYTSSFSLADAGILPNTYNDHRTFTKRKHAEKYLADVKSGLYTKSVNKDKLFCISDNSGTEGILYSYPVQSELAVLDEDYEAIPYESIDAEWDNEKI